MAKSLNPNNPYVLNEYYFENSTDRYAYNESKIYYIRFFNLLSIAVFGSVLLCFVFFLIAKKSPIAFKPYRKILMLTALVDLYMILQSVLIQARFKGYQGIGMITLSGLLPSFFGISHHCSLFVIQNQISVIETSVLPVQFYYRYYTVKFGNSPFALRTLLWFLLSLSFCSIPTATSLDKFCPSELNSKSIDYGRYWYPEVPIPPLIVLQFDQEVPFYKKITGFHIQIGYYLVMLIITWMTLKILKEKLSAINVLESVKKVQKQLSRIFFVQSCFPLFTLIMPQIMLFLSVYFKLDNNLGTEAINRVALWYPVFNLLSTIIFIEPYRKYCMRHIPFSKRFKQKTTVFVIFNPSNRL